MAKQSGPIFRKGLSGNLCFYQMEGKYYVRMKSSLQGKRVQSDPAFARTMQYAGLLAQASKISSALYRSLPEGAKTMGLYRKLTGKAMRWLKEGYKTEQVKILLQEAFVPKKTTVQQKKKSTEPVAENHDFADDVITAALADAFVDKRGLQFTFFGLAPPRFIHTLSLNSSAESYHARSKTLPEKIVIMMMHQQGWQTTKPGFRSKPNFKLLLHCKQSSHFLLERAHACISLY